MAESTLTDDETRAAFGTLRAEALHEIHAPGPGAARRALRRRRRGTVAAAGAAVTVVTGVAGLGGSAALTAAGAPARTAGPTAGGSAGPTASPTPVTATDPTTRLPSDWAKGDAIAAFVVDQDGGRDSGVRVTPKVPGTYTFRVMCSGAGTGQIVLLEGGGGKVTRQVTCGEQPEPVSVEIEIETVSWLEVSFVRDPGTTLRDTEDGWAVRVEGPTVEK